MAVIDPFSKDLFQLFSNHTILFFPEITQTDAVPVRHILDYTVRMLYYVAVTFGIDAKPIFFLNYNNLCTGTFRDRFILKIFSISESIL